jgi:predicted DNA-binding protein
MMLSIELDPILEMRIAQEARRLGKTQAELVKDILEQMLRAPDPYALLEEIRSKTPTGDPSASENISWKIKEKLRAKHSG